MALTTNRKLLSILGILVYTALCVVIVKDITAEHVQLAEVQAPAKPTVQRLVKDTTVLVNEKVEAYIKKANPEITEDRAREISSQAIIQSGGDIEKLSLLIAVFQVESRFDHSSRSERGAVGIGQVTSSAVDEYKLETGKKINPRKLSSNIRLSAWTLENIKRKYSKSEKDVPALIAYNGGLKQLRKYQSGQPLCKQTREYVVKVTAIQKDLRGVLS